MPGRFVILHHTTDAGEHWDLMLESGDVLLTWQLPVEPVCTRDLRLPARRIGDHRKAYLEYEGPISRGRGRVRRIDGGGLEWVEQASDRVRFRLSGGRLEGLFTLRLEGADLWVLALSQLPEG